MLKKNYAKAIVLSTHTNAFRVRLESFNGSFIVIVTHNDKLQDMMAGSEFDCLFILGTAYRNPLIDVSNAYLKFVRRRTTITYRLVPACVTHEVVQADDKMFCRKCGILFNKYTVDENFFEERRSFV
jgi:hypothetical protein